MGKKEYVEFPGRVTVWGSSHVVIIPKPIVRSFGLEDGDVVIVRIKKTGMKIVEKRRCGRRRKAEGGNGVEVHD